jgi:hypothetical protein
MLLGRSLAYCPDESIASNWGTGVVHPPLPLAVFLTATALFAGNGVDGAASPARRVCVVRRAVKVPPQGVRTRLTGRKQVTAPQKMN